MDRIEIYDVLANAISAYDWETYVAQRYEPIPPQIPCVFIQQINKVRTRRYATLDNTDQQHRLTFEVQVFHETLNDAYDLMGIIERTFKELAFFEDLCTPIDNADISVARIVARFTAQVGDYEPDDAKEGPDGGGMEPWDEGDTLDGGVG